jgi:hypothetical protein
VRFDRIATSQGGAMDIGEIKIREWCESDGETIPFGTLTYRVYTMVAALDRDKADVKALLIEYNLGISYAIGHQLRHLMEVEKSGQDEIVVAYNHLKYYFRKTLNM